LKLSSVFAGFDKCETSKHDHLDIKFHGLCAFAPCRVSRDSDRQKLQLHPLTTRVPGLLLTRARYGSERPCGTLKCFYVDIVAGLAV